jgi:hypothetical protein
MRWIAGGKAVGRGGASTSQMGRFKIELLATDENLAALADLSGKWIDGVHDCNLSKQYRARHGQVRQSNSRGAGRHGLQRPLRLHLLSPTVRVQPVR